MIQITDVRALPGDAAFLLDLGKKTVLYDTGFAFTGERVAVNIKKILGDRPLDEIFLTHSHYDHAAGTPYILKHFPQARVVAGEYAAKIFAKDSAKAIMRRLDRKFADTLGVGEYEDLFDSLHVTLPVADGQRIPVGETDFFVVALPGHTKCSVGYFCPEEKLLLSSETLGVYDGAGGVVPSFLVGYQMALDSIEKVKKMDVERILLPHFGVLEKEEVKAYLEEATVSAVTTAKEIAALLRAGEEKEKIIEFFKDKFYHGYIPKIYPKDAMELNTGIMIDLIERELL